MRIFLKNLNIITNAVAMLLRLGVQKILLENYWVGKTYFKKTIGCVNPTFSLNALDVQIIG